jgi:DNA-3-methyladenine glycosylase I
MKKPAPIPADVVRCGWASSGDELYARYHDDEWGVPKTDSRALFEKMVLEGFQSGLSWITILRKRENFRRAFAEFDPERIARFGAKDFARLMADEGIVRNRLKIEATIDNAKAYLKLSERISFAAFLWGFFPNGPIVNNRETLKDIPGATDLSKTISKALKAEGFRFVGPTTIYAFMQSVGMVNDHVADCHRHGACKELQRTFKRPGAKAS